jgi:hypothetical protein
MRFKVHGLILLSESFERSEACRASVVLARLECRDHSRAGRAVSVAQCFEVCNAFLMRRA